MKFLGQKHHFITTVVFMGVVTLCACTDAQRSKIGGLNSEFKVEMINCDGTVARSWVSSGKVSNESNSDGYYFKDKETGQLVEVTGRLVITKIKD